jgi:4-hydroxy-tetrahydrodipicolinate reductase
MKIAINGACGRMGQAVGRLVLAEKDLSLAAAIESPSSKQIGADYGKVLGRDDLGVPIASSLTSKVDALIDFSTPSAALDRIAECVKTKSAAVVCTTGFDPAQRKQIEAAAKKIPVLNSTNMSVGVNLLFKILPEIAKTLGEDYDIEIVETHHRLKKDAPSGTAVTMAERIAGARGKKYPDDFNFGRRGIVGERKKGEIGVHAVRGGDVVGEHRVYFMAEGELVEITHRASTRELFARGALRAARFVAKAKPGLYSMLDALA